jgi:hypothetical protein
MHTYLFLTRNEKDGGFTKWCETNDPKWFDAFFQWAKKSNRPEDFIIYDKDSNEACRLIDVKSYEYKEV